MPATTAIQVRGVGGVPATATAVWINLTIADPATPAVLLAYPGPCASPPLASTVNTSAGRNMASAALVGIGSDGTICVAAMSGRTHVVLDIAGWFGEGPNGLVYKPQRAVRLLDTRQTSAAPSTAPATAVLATTAVLNVAVVDSVGAGFVTVRPCATTATSSLINSAPAEDTANVIAVAPGSQQKVCVSSSTPAHLVVDQVGTFVAS